MIMIVCELCCVSLPLGSGAVVQSGSAGHPGSSSLGVKVSSGSKKLNPELNPDNCVISVCVISSLLMNCWHLAL